MTTTCPSPETLERLLAGHLAGPEAQRLTNHLERCDRCTETAAGLRVDDTLVLSLRASSEVAAANDPYLDQLVEQVSELLNRGTIDRPPTESAMSADDRADSSYSDVLSPPERADELGRLGPYRIIRVLGAGGMGVVFQAEEIPLARMVALKIIRPGLAAHPGIRERFLREARAIATVEDERIVTIHHVGEERGVPFITMQLLRGQTLEERLSEFEQATGRRTLPIDESIRIGREVATGLAAAHAKGVLHRDVKPGNIFLAEGGAVKLLDFGLARGIGDAALTQIGIVAGTPAYVAPEQVAGRTVDQRGDLYGLGCVLYRLTAGRTPFGRIGPRAASPGAGSDLPESPTQANPEVPIALSELIQQLLAKDPSERPSSAAQIARRLLESDGRGHADSKGSTSLGNRQRASFRLRIALLTGGLALATFAVIFTIQISIERGKLSVSIDHQKRNETGDPTGEGTKNSAAEFDEWMHLVASLSAADQLAAVSKKMQERNPGFDGNIGPRFVGGQVVEVHLITDEVTDIEPIRALSDVEYLVCRGSAPGRGKLRDLAPLKHLKSLHYLDCSSNPIDDLYPLRSTPLRELVCWATLVRELDALRPLELKMLNVDQTLVSDLVPIRNMPLRRLQVNARYITNLDAVETLNLAEITCNFRPARHTALLRKIASLTTINERPVAEFWRDVDARRTNLEAWIARVAALPAERQVEETSAKLRELNPRFDGQLFPTIKDGQLVELMIFVDKVTDISPVRALKSLKFLTVRRAGAEGTRAPLFNLDPVRDLSLDYLDCGGTEVADLSALEGMSLQVISCWGTWVRDLTPIKKLPVFYLDCRDTPVTDLSPLVGSVVRRLDVRGCAVTDFSPLKDQFLVMLYGVFDLERDREILRSIKPLTEINGMPADQFWKSFVGPPPK